MQINPYRPKIGIADFGDYINRFGSNISRYISKEIPTSIFPFYTVDYKYIEDQKELMNDLIAKKVSYVVIKQLGYSSTYRYLVPVINNNMQRFQIIHKIDNPETLLLKLQ